MPERFHLTRRFAAAMTDKAYRRLRRLAAEAELEEAEALSFLLEELDRVTDRHRFAERLRQFKAGLEARKR